MAGDNLCRHVCKAWCADDGVNAVKQARENIGTECTRKFKELMQRHHKQDERNNACHGKRTDAKWMWKLDCKENVRMEESQIWERVQGEWESGRKANEVTAACRMTQRMKMVAGWRRMFSSSYPARAFLHSRQQRCSCSLPWFRSWLRRLDRFHTAWTRVHHCHRRSRRHTGSGEGRSQNRGDTRSRRRRWHCPPLGRRLVVVQAR